MKNIIQLWFPLWFPNNKYHPNTKNYRQCFVLGGVVLGRRDYVKYVCHNVCVLLFNDYSFQLVRNLCHCCNVLFSMRRGLQYSFGYLWQGMALKLWMRLGPIHWRHFRHCSCPRNAHHQLPEGDVPNHLHRCDEVRVACSFQNQPWEVQVKCGRCQNNRLSGKAIEFRELSFDFLGCVAVSCCIIVYLPLCGGFCWALFRCMLLSLRSCSAAYWFSITLCALFPLPVFIVQLFPIYIYIYIYIIYSYFVIFVPW